MDGIVVGSVMPDVVTTISSVESGTHVLELWYADGIKESRSISIDPGQVAIITSSHIFNSSIPMNYVIVEPSAFLMGSGNGEDGENPVHQVVLTRPFTLSRYEVTFAEYDEFCISTDRDRPDDRGWGRDTRPVINVSWYDSIAYCNWLSAQEGLIACYSGSGRMIRCDFSANGYRLPTEAEWEFAARGGAFSQDYLYAGSNDIALVGWYWKNTGEDDIGRKIQPVGDKQPNELGIYDMSGNVAEWCWDWYENYSDSIYTDPRGPASGSSRVYRGGSWHQNDNSLRVADRGVAAPSFSYFGLGFRLVRTASATDSLEPR